MTVLVVVLLWARLLLAATFAVALVYLMATYRTPAEDGESNRSETRTFVSQ